MEKKSAVKKAVKKKALARPSRTMSVDELWAFLERSNEDSTRRIARIERIMEESAQESARRNAELDRRREESDRERARIKEESDRESARRNAELDRRREENDRKWARLNEDWARRHEEIMRSHEESRRRHEELDDDLKKLGKRIGGINDNVGFHAEQFFQDALDKTLTFGGEKYDELYRNVTYKKGINVEIDILLVNGKSVALIEAKNRIHPNHVKDLIEKKVVRFRQFFPAYQNHTIYLGMAAFSFCDDVLKDAKNHGICIIRQVGEGVEMEMGNLKAY